MSRSDLLKAVSKWEAEAVSLLYEDVVHKVIESASPGLGYDYGHLLFDVPSDRECGCREIPYSISTNGEDWCDTSMLECWTGFRLNLPFQAQTSVNWLAWALCTEATVDNHVLIEHNARAFPDLYEGLVVK